MSESKKTTSISNADSYLAIGEFWDSHDVTDVWEQTRPVDMVVEIESEATYHAVEPTLSARLRKLANSRGISTETLTNLWLREKLEAELASRPTD